MLQLHYITNLKCSICNSHWKPFSPVSPSVHTSSGWPRFSFHSPCHRIYWQSRSRHSYEVSITSESFYFNDVLYRQYFLYVIISHLLFQTPRQDIRFSSPPPSSWQHPCYRSIQFHRQFHITCLQFYANKFCTPHSY